jgi:hypothetical protein
MVFGGGGRSEGYAVCSRDYCGAMSFAVLPVQIFTHRADHCGMIAPWGFDCIGALLRSSQQK